MNDLQPAVKFILWAAVVALVWSEFGSLKKMTVRMAEMAMEAQAHDQLSWNQFSRQLWQTPRKK